MAAPVCGLNVLAAGAGNAPSSRSATANLSSNSQVRDKVCPKSGQDAPVACLVRAPEAPDSA